MPLNYHLAIKNFSIIGLFMGRRPLNEHKNALYPYLITFFHARPIRSTNSKDNNKILIFDINFRALWPETEFGID